MKTLLILLSSLLLTGCATRVVPVKYSFPDLPKQLQEPCDKELPYTSANIYDFSETVAKNSGSFRRCSYKLKSVVEWHALQKKIFEDAQKGKVK